MDESDREFHIIYCVLLLSLIYGAALAGTVEQRAPIAGRYDAIAWRLDCPSGIPFYTEEPGFYWDLRRCEEKRRGDPPPDPWLNPPPYYMPA